MITLQGLKSGKKVSGKASANWVSEIHMIALLPEQHHCTMSHTNLAYIGSDIYFENTLLCCGGCGKMKVQIKLEGGGWIFSKPKIPLPSMSFLRQIGFREKNPHVKWQPNQ